MNLTYTKHDAVGIITFSRPKALNALNSEVLKELNTILDKIEASEDIRVIILTGEGKAFIAGADIAEMQGKSEQEAKAFSSLGHDVMNRIEQSPIPFIGALNGFTFGGGLEMALSCSFLLAAETAKFSAPEVNLGLIPGFGGSQRLVRAIGLNNARYYLYTANMFDATEALRMGLVQAVYSNEELMDKAMELAKLITSKGPLATRTLAAVVNCGLEKGFVAGCNAEQEAFAYLFNNEAQEGMSAFLEKRKPQW
ncbi:enoyl-CoA hydratase/isomerase family protein [Carboxylicivirga sediminis]|uniref:Enoyl-CoA hydratase/isomerase family protein n=1 Tax=Carboxylicivirga sediminis TaxID=2006564 RepID=A0A941EZI6_9BACT|nr:enoyl-CoA hydratase-related protein [Carboxylicivirga sediminis]MBR8534393.1 enoyl-CoA hydratase/isomerase family protein [Carboxylicivirga sediminis]